MSSDVNSFMTDLDYNTRAKIKEFSALAKSHIPECFALLAHPFVAMSVFQLGSPMGSLGLNKPGAVCVRVCVCARAVHLPPGQTASPLQKSHDHAECRNRHHLKVQWHLEVFFICQRGAGLKLEPETGLTSDS